jgi:hypothetical protein
VYLQEYNQSLRLLNLSAAKNGKRSHEWQSTHLFSRLFSKTEGNLHILSNIIMKARFFIFEFEILLKKGGMASGFF